MKQFFVVLTGVLVLCGAAVGVSAQQAKVPNGPPAPASGAPLPAGYVIGTEDVLTVVFWREPGMSAEVVVRPDGKISVPLLDDVQAAGYTPEQLSRALEKSAAKFVAEPRATIVVKAINSRKVFVVGRVTKPGSFPLASDMNVLQAIAMAGGLMDYADEEHIVVIRLEDGRERRMKFNYKDVVNGKNVQQNLLLKPGDTVVVK